MDPQPDAESATLDLDTIERDLADVEVALARLDASARRHLGRALTRLANAGVDDVLALAADEPGTLTFLVHTARDDEDTVVCFERYADDAAMVAHREGRALQAFMAVMGDLVAGPPEIVYLEPYSTPSM